MQAQPEIIVKVLKKYGLDFKTVLPAQSGYRNTSYPIVLNSGEKLNFILYKNEPDILIKIRNSNRISDYLSSHDFPTRQSIGNILKLSDGRHTRYGSLYTYLPGATIPWEVYTKHHIKLLGQTMSNMHAALSDINVTSMESVAEQYLATIKRMTQYFEDPQVTKAMHHKLQLAINANELDAFGELLQLCKKLPDQQMLHMDFVRSNILFDYQEGKLRISGILDFEKTSYGSPLFDIARTLAFLLVDCKYKSETKVRKYFLFSGYHKRGKASYKNTIVNGRFNTLECLIDLFLVHDFYKFLRHNPYEYLYQNEHFVRTRDHLRARKIIEI